MRKNPQIFWTIVLLLLVGGGWFGYKYYRGETPADIAGKVSDALSSGQKTEENLALNEGQTVTEVSSTEKQFKHTILGFSFSYLKDYSISSFGNYFDSAGETILLQKDAGDGKTQQGLQVLITPFDEDISLTIARIKKDLPSLHVLEAREQMISNGDVSAQAVVFSSDNNLSTGKSLEAWFIYRKNLYQISSPADSSDLFNKVISTWKLEQ